MNLEKGELRRYTPSDRVEKQTVRSEVYEKGKLHRWEDTSFTVTTEKYAYEVYDCLFQGFDDPREPDGNGYKTLEQAQEWLNHRCASIEVENGRYYLVYGKLRPP